MRLRLANRLTSLVAAAVLMGSNWALREFCETYSLTSLTRRPEFPTPAERICWASDSGLIVVVYLSLLVLAVAAVWGDRGTHPLARTVIRVFVFLGVLVSLGMLILTLVTFYFYRNLDPNFL